MQAQQFWRYHATTAFDDVRCLGNLQLDWTVPAAQCNAMCLLHLFLAVFLPLIFINESRIQNLQLLHLQIPALLKDAESMREAQRVLLAASRPHGCPTAAESADKAKAAQALAVCEHLNHNLTLRVKAVAYA